MQDMIKKKRNKNPRGEENGNAKLKEFQVRQIREFLKLGLSHTKIGKMYRVNRKTISKISNKFTWRHVV